MTKVILLMFFSVAVLTGCDVGKTTSYICTSDCSEDNSDNSDNSVTNDAE